MPFKIKKITKNSHSEIARKIDMIYKDKDESKQAKSHGVEDKPRITDKKANDSKNTASKVKPTRKDKKSSSKKRTKMKKFKKIKKEKKLKPSKLQLLEESKIFQEKLDKAKKEDDKKKFILTRLINPNGKALSEKTGFGWKGLGSRKIIFDDKLK